MGVRHTVRLPVPRSHRHVSLLRPGGPRSLLLPGSLPNRQADRRKGSGPGAHATLFSWVPNLPRAPRSALLRLIDDAHSTRLSNASQNTSNAIRWFASGRCAACMARPSTNATCVRSGCRSSLPAALPTPRAWPRQWRWVPRACRWERPTCCAPRRKYGARHG